MSYGVNTLWAAQPGRARSAGSSKRKSTRTAKRKTSGSARHAKKKRSTSKSKSRASKLTLAQRRRLQRLAPWQQKEFWQTFESQGNAYYSGNAEASLTRAENLY